MTNDASNDNGIVPAVIAPAPLPQQKVQIFGFWQKVPKRLDRGVKASLVSIFTVPALAYAGMAYIDPEALSKLTDSISGTKMALYGISSLVATNITSVIAQEFTKEGRHKRMSSGLIDSTVAHAQKLRRGAVFAAALAVTGSFFGGDAINSFTSSNGSEVSVKANLAPSAPAMALK